MSAAVEVRGTDGSVDTVEEFAEPPVLIASEFQILGLHLGFVEDCVEALDQRQQTRHDPLLTFIGDEARVVVENRLGRMGGDGDGLTGADIDVLLEQQCLSRLERFVGIEQSVHLGCLTENGVDTPGQQVETL